MGLRPLRIVIAGGGVAGLETALALRALAPDLTDIALVAPNPTFALRAAAVGEPFGMSEVRRFDLDSIAAEIGVELHDGSLACVEAEERRMILADGTVLGYDALVLACGARARPAVRGAITFAGPDDVPALTAVLADVDRREVRTVAVAIPASVGWTLPAYELALLMAKRVGLAGSVAIVSPEGEPLAAFGGAASREIRALLEKRRVDVHLRRTPVEAVDGRLRTRPSDEIAADRVIALPRLEGIPIPGVPATATGLVRTDEFGRVASLCDVYAAGDLTAFPVKQGGIAAEQADVIARMLAAEAGADVRVEPFRPVLRAVLVTGAGDRFLRADIGGGRGDSAHATSEPLWWPPVKTPGRYLAPYLAGLELRVHG
jgi:sulfide:quinone oxidoreductase